jgi:putative acetyltransferase
MKSGFLLKENQKNILFLNYSNVKVMQQMKELVIRVSLETPNQPDVIALIAELDAYQRTLYPAEVAYALDLVSLSKPNVIFAVARNMDGAAMGCGAIVMNDVYGEIKRMYVRPDARGHGIAQQIIDTLESSAYAQGCRKLMLETGPYQPAALAFYVKQGFSECGPFGEYPAHPLSIFMVKSLELTQD